MSIRDLIDRATQQGQRDLVDWALGKIMILLALALIALGGYIVYRSLGK